MNAERMTPEDWNQLHDAYSSEFQPLINPERNVLAAIVDLRRHVTQDPLIITAPYTLQVTDHDRTIFLNGAAVTIPVGLPSYFRCRLRNIELNNTEVLAASGVTLRGTDGVTLAGPTDFTLLQHGWAELECRTPNVFHLFGHIEGI